jgi:hypothetical protein
MIGRSAQDRVGSVNLFQGHQQGEFVLQGHPAQGKNEIGIFSDRFVVTISSAGDQADTANPLRFPALNQFGELTTRQLQAPFI